jgi:hypothetical protein
MYALKLIPQLFSFAALVVVLARSFPERRRVASLAAGVSFLAGVLAVVFLAPALGAAVLFGLVRSVLGVGFLFLWAVAVVALYRSTGRGESALRGTRWLSGPLGVGLCPALAGLTAGLVAACRLTGGTAPGWALPALLAGAALLALGAFWLEGRLPARLHVSLPGALAAVMSLLLFSAAYLIRLDLFSPLSMKVMKGVHDFVHQFMESILTPDHLFVRPVVWKYIGVLFGKEVGFWGGMVIWFTPALSILLAIRLKRLPSVAHIRQGAERRKLIAAAIFDRRLLMLAPLCSLAILGAAAYRSTYPAVEYWDPKPLPVAANPAGEILIPMKGEVDLQDGQLHKYLFKKGSVETRFFVLLNPAGKLTVDLDACAICKPEGYGQAEGAVICYYCKTLIPLETVGQQGGCNPVPVAFKERPDGVAIDAITLVNTWRSTIQTTSGGKEAGK